MSRQKKPRLKPASVLRYDELEEDPLSSSDPRETRNPEMHVSGLGTAEDPASERGSSPQPKTQQPLKEPSPSQDSRSPEPAEEPDARALRLARIKAEIEAGEYETPDKLDAALSRLFDEIGLEDEDHACG